MNQAVKAAKKPAAPKAAAPMLVKFRTDYNANRIDVVEVLRETNASVFFLGSHGRTECREAKMSDWKQYHDTWADAHAYLMAKAQSCVDRARRALELANGHLGNVKGMKPPRDGA